jgi:hypothetical protein
VKSPVLAVAALAAASVVALAAAPASAQTQVDVDWRQHDRADHFDRSKIVYPKFYFELRFGAYYPRVDTEPALGGNKPYEKIYGTAPRFLLSVEFDWLVLRIPYVGGFGPGISWGWTAASAKAKIDIDHNPNTGSCDGSLDGCYSAEDTTLTIFPMYGVLVLRIDEPLHRLGIPVVPYVKFGIDGMIWTAGTTSGKVYTDPKTGNDIAASGWSWGEHVALGGALSLNWLDREAVNRSRESSGVRDFYAFGEWANYGFKTIGSDKQLRVGSSSWVVGVAFDF